MCWWKNPIHYGAWWWKTQFDINMRGELELIMKLKNFITQLYKKMVSKKPSFWILIWSSGLYLLTLIYCYKWYWFLLIVESLFRTVVVCILILWSLVDSCLILVIGNPSTSSYLYITCIVMSFNAREIELLIVNTSYQYQYMIDIKKKMWYDC